MAQRAWRQNTSNRARGGEEEEEERKGDGGDILVDLANDVLKVLGYGNDKKIE
jgi:hypothetical protein